MTDSYAKIYVVMWGGESIINLSIWKGEIFIRKQKMIFRYSCYICDPFIYLKTELEQRG